MSIYFAHPKFTPEQTKFADKVTEVLREVCRNHLISIQAEYGNSYTPSDYEIDNLIRDPFKALPAVESSSPATKAIIAPTIYSANVRLMENSDICVAITDDRDIGVIFELGYMACNQKKIITISQHDFGTNIMIAQATIGHVPNFNENVDMFKAILGEALKSM